MIFQFQFQFIYFCHTNIYILKVQNTSEYDKEAKEAHKKPRGLYGCGLPYKIKIDYIKRMCYLTVYNMKYCLDKKQAHKQDKHKDATKQQVGKRENSIQKKCFYF